MNVMEQVKADPSGSAHYALGYITGCLIEARKVKRLPREARKFIDDAIAQIDAHDERMRRRLAALNAEAQGYGPAPECDGSKP